MHDVPDASGVSGEEELSALPAAELAARLSEAYRLIGELTARNERLARRIEQLERQAGKDSATSSRYRPLTARTRRRAGTGRCASGGNGGRESSRTVRG